MKPNDRNPKKLKVAAAFGFTAAAVITLQVDVAGANPVEDFVRKNFLSGTDPIESNPFAPNNAEKEFFKGDGTLIGGSPFNDTLIGNPEKQNTVFGWRGGDAIYGGRKGDFLNGDSGDDYLFGRHGPDELNGGGGNDQLFGAEGNDEIAGGGGGDLISGGHGDDTLRGDEGDDFLSGGSGRDLLSAAGGGNNNLHGGSGRDILISGLGDDTLNGGPGDDLLIASRGDNTLIGGRGDDRILGGLGENNINGGEGYDITFNPGTGKVENIEELYTFNGDYARFEGDELDLAESLELGRESDQIGTLPWQISAGDDYYSENTGFYTRS